MVDVNADRFFFWLLQSSDSGGRTTALLGNPGGKNDAVDGERRGAVGGRGRYFGF